MPVLLYEGGFFIVFIFVWVSMNGGAMEIRDAKSIKARSGLAGAPGASVRPLYPAAPRFGAGSLLAVDLWEIEPGSATTAHEHSEEHVLFVLSGSGELLGERAQGPAATLRPDSVAYIGPHEPHSLRNTGAEPLRVLVSTPLLVRSGRAMGNDLVAQAEQAPAPGSETPADHEPIPPQQAEAPKSPDISGLVKKASELVGAPRPERRKPAPLEPEPVVLPAQPGEPEPEEEAEADGASNLMELFVAFDGGSRGNPGQGYGSYLVQSPGRRPVIKRVEFGDNYTSNQAEYDTLTTALRYIIERLRATNRTPQQVQLDIRTDSDLVVNQLLGNFKVKDAGMKARHAEALELLDQFADWRIEWHQREESVRLFGH